MSPDGRWIAYTDRASGQDEIYVRPFPKVDDGRWQVSNDGAYMPRWRADNNEIYFFTRSDFMAVEVNISDSKFEIGQPKILFTKILNFSGNIAAVRYAAANDGERFLMNIPLNTNSDDHIIIVQNWLAELTN